MTDILVIQNLCKNFGKLTAISDLSFTVRQGEIFGLMGPNGAGKTTVFNLLTGAFKPDKGKIYFKNENITRNSPAERCHKGIGRTYQIPQPFEGMSVLENLLVAAVHGAGLPEKKAKEISDDILDMMGLFHRRNQLSGYLTLLDRKRLELARAMATQPSLMLIDEVAAGLTEGESEQIMATVRTLQARNITIIWIEHIPMMMSEGVDRLLVISEGRWLNCGSPDEVMNSDEVLECYMGTGEDI